MKERVSAVILSAGNGSRMKLNNITKQELIIGGETVLHRTVSIFNSVEEISEIVVVVRYDQLDFAREELASFDKVSSIVVGGYTRFESAKIGFSSISDMAEYVAIHDVARCFITEDMIRLVISDAVKYGAATAASAVTDTVKLIDGEGCVKGTVNRDTVVTVQTPQIFNTNLYREALASVVDTSRITDDNMLLEAIGVGVHCTLTGKGNIKLTTEEDIRYANYLVDMEKENE